MKLNIFNREKLPEEIELEEDRTPNVRYYFKLLWRKLTKLFSINLLGIFQFIPLVIAYFIYFWADTTPSISPDCLSFPVLHGIATLDPTPGNQLLLVLCSPQYHLPIVTLWMNLLYVGLIALFAITFGWFNVGFTYLMREMINGRPVFIFSDLKHAIKKNAKQGFFMGILDFLILFVLYTNLSNLSNGVMAGFMGDVSYVANLAIAIVYLIMRFYLYMMLVTFDMKIVKIIKNALIFVMLGIKRNLLAILWIAVLLGLNLLVLTWLLPFGLLLPFFYIVSFPMFTTAYAAYPVIQRYMINPSPYADTNEPDDTEDESEHEEK